jgi:hypothetical protein
MPNRQTTCSLAPGTCSTAPRTRCCCHLLCSFRCAASPGRSGRYKTRNARPGSQRWANAGARCDAPTLPRYLWCANRRTARGGNRGYHVSKPWVRREVTEHPVALAHTRAAMRARRTGCAHACAAVTATQTLSAFRTHKCKRALPSSRACAPGCDGTGRPRGPDVGPHRLTRCRPRQRRPPIARARLRRQPRSPSRASHLSLPSRSRAPVGNFQMRR